MDDKIQIEKKFLHNTEELIQELLENHMRSSQCQLDAFTKSKIKKLVTRVVNQEVEYLYDDPQNYFEIYGEDHLNN
jgi:hypothetical protein